MKKLLIIAIAILLMAAACNQTTPPAGPGEQVLVPGGSVEGPDGVRLEADSTTITDAITVSIHKVAAPELPLPEGITAVSDVYQLASEEDAEAEDDSAFILSTPVPEGADRDTLALAVYIEPEEVDGDFLFESPTWEFIDGAYDAAERSFVTQVYTLPQSGHRVQLVSGLEFVILEPAGDTELETASSQAFKIICEVQGVATWCTNNLVGAYRTAHQGLYSEFDTMGFREPRLGKTLLDREYKIHLRVFRIVSETSEVCDRTAAGRAISGVYYSGWKKIVLCVDANNSNNLTGNQLTDGRARTARHEYFHALQYAYRPVRQTNSWKWLIEGTAVASENSTATTLGRNMNRPLFPVDVRLTQVDSDELYQYRAQDFFLYLGHRLAPGQGIGYTRTLMTFGAGTTEVSQGISSFNHSELTNLKRAYWAWAKNQAIEKTYNPGNGLGTPCVLHNQVATPIVRTLAERGSSTSINQTLQPLTSRVIEVSISSRPYDSEVSLNLSVGGANAWIAAYTASDCAQLETNTLAIPAGTSERLLILASNGEFGPGMTRNFSASLTRSSEPGLTIVMPNQTTFDEGSIAFRADVTGLDPDTVTINWSYNLPAGTLVTFGSSQPGEVISRVFCDGSYTIRAHVSSGPGAGLEDTVTITVNDLGASNPPPQCAPSISIVEPAAGSTFAVGQDIPLRAIFSDSSNFATPRYPIIWRLDGPDGMIIGTGPESATKRGAGEHLIYVSYGAASDAVTINVIDTTASPLSATITSPEDGATFSWFEEGAYTGGHTVTVTGTGVSGGGATLPGSALTWAIRLQGSSNWSVQGTGNTRNIDFQWSSCGWQTWEIRLEVKDAEGLSGFDFIEISVQPPPC